MLLVRKLPLQHLQKSKIVLKSVYHRKPLSLISLEDNLSAGEIKNIIFEFSQILKIYKRFMQNYPIRSKKLSIEHVNSLNEYVNSIEESSFTLKTLRNHATTLYLDLLNHFQFQLFGEL